MPRRGRSLARLDHDGLNIGMSRETLTRAIANSICFGVYQGRELIGLGRAVTDLATYAYWTDVVIAPAHRGRRGSG